MKIVLIEINLLKPELVLTSIFGLICITVSLDGVLGVNDIFGFRT